MNPRPRRLTFHWQATGDRFRRRARLQVRVEPTHGNSRGWKVDGALKAFLVSIPHATNPAQSTVNIVWGRDRAHVARRVPANAVIADRADPLFAAVRQERERWADTLRDVWLDRLFPEPRSPSWRREFYRPRRPPFSTIPGAVDIQARIDAQFAAAGMTEIEPAR